MEGEKLWLDDGFLCEEGTSFSKGILRAHLRLSCIYCWDEEICAAYSGYITSINVGKKISIACFYVKYAATAKNWQK